VVVSGGAVIAGALVDDDVAGASLLLGWPPVSLLPHAAATATAAAQQNVNPSVRIGRRLCGIVFAFGRGVNFTAPDLPHCKDIQTALCNA
jgi:hypothetical protein